MNLSSLRRISAVGWLDVDPAAKTLCAANRSNTIRRALLAKSRQEHEPLQVGDYA